MITETLSNAEQKMKASIEGLRKELASIRTSHATPALVEHIRVEYAGVPTPLNQLAGISAPQANLLVVQPWDPSSLREIEKAILKSDLGLNPSNDGHIIRLSIPPLSEERRQELIKVVKRRVEDRKVSLRNIRRDAVNELKGLEKDKEISQDEHRRALEQLQKITDRFTTESDTVRQQKEAELAEV